MAGGGVLSAAEEGKFWAEGVDIPRRRCYNIRNLFCDISEGKYERSDL